ncbi:MAG: CPBP family intramembrane glutamic endopeptidase [Pirellulales bacterium]
MPVLVALVVLPLAIIAAQSWLGASGALGSSIYKLSFLVPPLIYCRAQGLHLGRDIFRWRNWRNHLPLAVLLGVLGGAIFLGAYAALGNLLLDKSAITEKIHRQFSVTAATVLMIAPVTIVANSLLEEFFYRGFAFGLLAPRHPWLGTLLPAGVFTVQHLLFIYHWVTLLPLLLAIVGLFVFALVLQALYAKADSIVAPWIVHILGDVAMMLIAVQLVFAAVGAEK